MAAQNYPGSPPRVVLLTSPGLFGAEIINRLAADDKIDLVGVGLTNRIYKGKGTLAGIHAFRLRTGWRYFFYGALHSNISWTWLRMTGRPAGLKRVAGNVRLLNDVNSPTSIDWLRGLHADYLASFFFNQWIGPEVRGVAACGAFNLHPSLLPALRGPDPIFRAIERGLPTSGYTIHRIDDEMDGGQICYQTASEIPQGLSAFALYLKAIHEGSDLFANWLGGALPRESQIPANSDGGDYTTFPTPEEVGRFVQSGHRLIRLSEWRRALSAVR